MDAHAGTFAGGIESTHDPVLMIEPDAAIDVGRNTAHYVMGRRLDGNSFARRFDPEIRPGKARDLGKFFVDDGGRKVREVEIDVLRSIGTHDAAAFANFCNDRARDHIARREVLYGRSISF